MSALVAEAKAASRGVSHDNEAPGSPVHEASPVQQPSPRPDMGPPPGADPPWAPDPGPAQQPDSPVHAYPPPSAFAPQQVYAPPVVIAGGTSTNGFAIASLVLGIVWLYWLGSLLALIFGAVALSQIRGSSGRQTGEGMAIAGLVLGIVGLAIFFVLLIIGASVA